MANWTTSFFLFSVVVSDWQDWYTINHVLLLFQSLFRALITRWIFCFHLILTLNNFCQKNSAVIQQLTNSKQKSSYFQKKCGKGLFQRPRTRPLPNLVTNQGQIRILHVKRRNLRYPTTVCVNFDSSYCTINNVIAYNEILVAFVADHCNHIHIWWNTPL